MHRVLLRSIIGVQKLCHGQLEIIIALTLKRTSVVYPWLLRFAYIATIIYYHHIITRSIEHGEQEALFQVPGY